MQKLYSHKFVYRVMWSCRQIQSCKVRYKSNKALYKCIKLG